MGTPKRLTEETAAPAAQLPVKEPVLNSDYAAPYMNGSATEMVNKSFSGSHRDPRPAHSKKAKEPTPFSKKYPLKRADLPEQYKAVLTWRPTQKLTSGAGKPRGPKAD